VKKFIAAAAMLALASAPALAAPPPPVFNWSGFYAGGNIGSGLEQGQPGLPPNFISFSPGPSLPTTTSYHGNGIVGGAQAGYNWQFTNWVVGLEADLGASDARSTLGFLFPAGVIFTSLAGTTELRTDFFGTARGRIGYATGNLLFYGTGGFAWVHEKFTTSGTTFVFASPIGTFASSDSQWIGGWTAGGGVDYAFAPNWFVRLEYLHVGLGSHNFAIAPAVTGASTVPVTSRFDIVRVGLNYKFGY